MKLGNKLTAIVFAGAMVLTGNAMAAPVHTWHTIRALDGNWTGKLQMLNEGGGLRQHVAAAIRDGERQRPAAIRYATPDEIIARPIISKCRSV